MIVTAKDFPVKISKKLFSASWNKKRKKSNITSITLHEILQFESPVSMNYFTDVDELCSTEEDKSEYTIIEKKDAGNEVIYDVPNFNVSKVFECRRNNPMQI